MGKKYQYREDTNRTHMVTVRFTDDEIARLNYINERLNHLENTHTLLKAASEEVLDACQLNRLINSDEYFRLTGKKMSMRKRLALDQELQRRQPEQRQQAVHRNHNHQFSL